MIRDIALSAPQAPARLGRSDPIQSLRSFTVNMKCKIGTEFVLSSVRRIVSRRGRRSENADFGLLLPRGNTIRAKHYGWCAAWLNHAPAGKFSSHL